MRSLALVLLVVLAACPRPKPAVSLDGDWPADPGSYRDVTARWTRSGEINRDYQLVAEVDATLLSPPWRAAWVADRARKGNLSDAAVAELLAQQQAIAEEAVEVAIVLTTWDRRENDLDRGKRSVWRVALVDGAGNEILPVEIRRDRRPDMVLRAEFPEYGDFSRVYLARFPKTGQVFGPAVEQVQLRMSSPRGGIELTWRDSD